MPDHLNLTQPLDFKGIQSIFIKIFLKYQLVLWRVIDYAVVFILSNTYLANR